MLKIYAKFDNNGHISQYRADTSLEGAEEFDVEDFDHEKFRFYKQVDGSLVFDEARYQDWLNPVENPSQQKSMEEVILAKAETKTINIIMEMGLL
ncbi:MAG: hypothetical protein ABS917_11395 [Solibacillus sp.]|uniref:hypothetical protein n=1 Tax=Solibacillus sp. TaxID=1909654 RepID=UPI0033155EF7